MNVTPTIIKRRLLNLQDPTGQAYNLLLVRYAQERALFRISQSQHADRFMIKGGMLITALTTTMSRATRDIDVMGNFDISIEGTRRIVSEAIATNVVPDGLTFLVDGMTCSTIRADSDYGGVRCRIPVTLGDEPTAIQVDVSVGHRVYEPTEFDFPSLIEELPAARLLAYSKESVIAEKLEAIAKLGSVNTRSKDFADIVALSESYNYLAGVLWTAFQLTFRKRGTAFADLVPAINPVAASPQRESIYVAFLRRAHARGAPPNLADCMRKIARFVSGPRLFSDDGIEREWECAESAWHEVAL